IAWASGRTQCPGAGSARGARAARSRAAPLGWDGAARRPPLVDHFAYGLRGRELGRAARAARHERGRHGDRREPRVLPPTVSHSVLLRPDLRAPYEARVLASRREV